jgi:hypothetical protein
MDGLPDLYAKGGWAASSFGSDIGVTVWNGDKGAGSRKAGRSGISP